MLRYPPSRRLLIVLGSLLAVAVMLSGWEAHYPRDWILENAIVAALVVFLVLSWKRLPLSTEATSCCSSSFASTRSEPIGPTRRSLTTRGPKTGSGGRSTPPSASNATTSTA